MGLSIGNKSSEKDIRRWLAGNGYCGRSARFVEVELHAIMRPGWLQVFRFEVKTVTAEGQTVQLLGAMRSDERYGKPAILVFDNVLDRNGQLDEWSEGLITQRAQRGN